MSVIKGFVVTAISTLLCGGLGCGCGFFLGTYAPDHYKSFYSPRVLADANLVHVGIGLGLTQGLAVGIVIGLVIVVSVAWYEAKKLSRRAADG